MFNFIKKMYFVLISKLRTQLVMHARTPRNSPYTAGWQEAVNACTIRRCASAPSRMVSERPRPRVFVNLCDLRDASPSLLTEPPHVKDSHGALQACQQLLIRSYSALVFSNVFRCGLDPYSTETVLQGRLWHGVQDPTGALTLSLLVVRRHRPSDASWLHGGADLCRETRETLAAILSVSHKVTSTTANCIGSVAFVSEVLQVFLHPGEWPVDLSGWASEAEAFRAREVSVLSEPLWRILNENPLSLAETILERLIFENKVSTHVAVCFRGSLFFLLGACMLNQSEDVLEALAKEVGIQAVAEGCCGLLFTLLKCMDSDDPVTQPLYTNNSFRAAQVVLKNSAAHHSDYLRFGPYTKDTLMPCPTSKLLSRKNLSHASKRMGLT